MHLGRDKKAPEKVPTFEADLDSGVIRRKSDGARVMAVGSVAWVTLEHELASTFVTGAAVILQRMGYSYGRYIGKVAIADGKEEADILDVIVRHSKESGWGRLSLNSGDITRGQAKIVAKECFFCLHWKESVSPVCFMLSGFINGVVDEMLGKTHRVLEERCLAKGDNVCEIAIDRLEA